MKVFCQRNSRNLHNLCKGIRTESKFEWIWGKFRARKRCEFQFAFTFASHEPGKRFRCVRFEVANAHWGTLLKKVITMSNDKTAYGENYDEMTIFRFRYRKKRAADDDQNKRLCICPVNSLGTLGIEFGTLLAREWSSLNSPMSHVESSFFSGSQTLKRDRKVYSGERVKCECATNNICQNKCQHYEAHLHWGWTNLKRAEK